MTACLGLSFTSNVHVADDKPVQSTKHPFALLQVVKQFGVFLQFTAGYNGLSKSLSGEFLIVLVHVGVFLQLI